MKIKKKFMTSSHEMFSKNRIFYMKSMLTFVEEIFDIHQGLFCENC